MPCGMHQKSPPRLARRELDSRYLPDKPELLDNTKHLMDNGDTSVGRPETAMEKSET